MFNGLARDTWVSYSTLFRVIDTSKTAFFHNYYLSSAIASLSAQYAMMSSRAWA